MGGGGGEGEKKREKKNTLPRSWEVVRSRLLTLRPPHLAREARRDGGQQDKAWMAGGGLPAD